MTRNNFSATFGLMTDVLARQSKEEFRKGVRKMLRETPDAALADWSRAIVELLVASDRWVVEGRAVALFGGLRNEPDLRPVLAWLASKSVPAAVFAIEQNSLVPFRVKGETDLVAGAMGVWEPHLETCEQLEIGQIGTILVPGLAFGRDGSRLGRGKAYYDGLLNDPECNARRIGVSFALQQSQSVPSEAHDAKMQVLISELGWLDIASGRLSSDYPDGPIQAASS
jgi:5-formyltetrahydrofolate cyclo-ligase